MPGAVYPWLRGEGKGVVDCLFSAGLIGVPDEPEPPDGLLVPMGATVRSPGPGLLPGDPPGLELLVRLEG